METLENKRIFISGSTDGIGKQTALELAEMKAEVIIHGRSEDRISSTVQMIKEKTGNRKVEGYKADFSSLAEVKDLAEHLLNTFDSLDILFNNAAMINHERILTNDGFEQQFQVNYLSHFLLTEKIMPLLLKKDNSRILNVSSMIHASVLEFDNLQGEKEYSAGKMYAQTKLMNILHTYSLADQIQDTKTVVHCLHPGVIDTKLLNTTWSGGAPLTEGSANMIYAASSETAGMNSAYYLENRRPMQSNPVSYDKSIQKKLRSISKEFVTEYL